MHCRKDRTPSISSAPGTPGTCWSARPTSRNSSVSHEPDARPPKRGSRGPRRSLRHALTLWRGPALADVRLGAVLEVEAAALAQIRLGVIETRIECDLVMGRHNAIIGELISLVAEYPSMRISAGC